MKNLILVISALFAVQAMADCSTQSSEDQSKDQLVISTDTPSYLKGATITVTLANGKSSSVPAEKFKVVPRKQQYIVTKIEKSTVTSCQVVTNEPSKNRARLMGGVGPTGFETSTTASTATVKSSTGAVGGLGYDRMLDNKFSVGGSALTNGTYILGIGMDF